MTPARISHTKETRTWTALTLACVHACVCVCPLTPPPYHFVGDGNACMCVSVFAGPAPSYHFVGDGSAVREVEGENVRPHPRQQVLHHRPEPPCLAFQVRCVVTLFSIAATGGEGGAAQIKRVKPDSSSSITRLKLGHSSKHSSLLPPNWAVHTHKSTNPPPPPPPPNIEKVRPHALYPYT